MRFEKSLIFTYLWVVWDGGVINQCWEGKCKARYTYCVKQSWGNTIFFNFFTLHQGSYYLRGSMWRSFNSSHLIIIQIINIYIFKPHRNFWFKFYVCNDFWHHIFVWIFNWKYEEGWKKEGDCAWLNKYHAYSNLVIKIYQQKFQY